MGSKKDSESPRSTTLPTAAPPSPPPPPAKCPGSGGGGSARRRRLLRLLSFQSVFSAAASAASSGPGVRRRNKAKARQEEEDEAAKKAAEEGPPPPPPAPEEEASAAASLACEVSEEAEEEEEDGNGDGNGSAPPSPPPSELECPLCLVRQPSGNAPRLLSCPHRSCRACLRQYLRIEITESRVHISCPECAERLDPADIRHLLRDSPQLVAKYEEFLLRRCLASDPDCRWCPAPDCGYAVIAYGCASCPKLTCEREGCQTEFCYHCKQIWHPNQTCDMARQQRAQTLQLQTKHTSGLSYGQESGPADDIKPCPRCSAYIIKMNDGSCNHMTCAVCGCEFCWLCMKEISDLHYLSPSGCTFWGKKPWSRKKKILWQLGTLIGAPVGISLIAGIAIPAMVIGIPVYVGKKIHSRYEGKKTSKHKRNLAITGGVTLSVIASPVIAAISVGIGVPIMLAYVYGVVPISLCRGGGCGVSTANGKGVKIEFDEDDGPITVSAEMSQGCAKGCDLCSEFNGYLRCSPKLFILLERNDIRQTGICLPSCPGGFFGLRNPDMNKCIKCKIKNCEECFSRNFCTKCKEDLYLHKGRCYAQDFSAANSTLECSSPAQCEMSEWAPWGPCLKKRKLCGFRRAMKSVPEGSSKRPSGRSRSVRLSQGSGGARCRGISAQKKQPWATDPSTAVPVNSSNRHSGPSGAQHQMVW
ncbi:E3 ubiquitin-protein ligase RNF19B-like isoform X2 [Anolis sagrei]|uniref:E3 ubiquitin-protein ligase RNF19B-like isoform X2 n=1 Tax=Anolis sagrei TaxID=38937 RepID=UPI003520017A